MKKISKKTLSMMDKSVKNLKKGKVSLPAEWDEIDFMGSGGMDNSKPLKMDSKWSEEDFKPVGTMPPEKVRITIDSNIDCMLRVYEDLKRDNISKSSLANTNEDMLKWIVMHLGRIWGEIDIIKKKLDLPHW